MGDKLPGLVKPFTELLRGGGGNTVPASATLALGVIYALFSAADPQLGSIVSSSNPTFISFMPNTIERPSDI